MPTHKIVFISREDNPEARNELSKLFKGKPNLYFKNLNDFRAYAQQNPQYIYDILQQHTLTSVLDPNEYNQEQSLIKVGFYLIFDDWTFVQDRASLINITQLIKYHLDNKDVSTPQPIERTSFEEIEHFSHEPEDKIIDVYILAESGQLRPSVENNITKFLEIASSFEDINFTLQPPVIRPNLPELNSREHKVLFINITKVPFAFLHYQEQTFGYIHVDEELFASPDQIDNAIQQLLASLEAFTQSKGNFNPLRFIASELLTLYSRPFDLSAWTVQNNNLENMAINNPHAERIVDNINLHKTEHEPKIKMLDPDNKNFILVFLGTDGSNDPENFVSRLDKFFNSFSSQCFVTAEEFFAQKALFDANAIYCFLDFGNHNYELISQKLTAGFYVHLPDWNLIKDKNVYNMFVIFKNLLNQGFYGHYINYKYQKN
ncbi:hypothetical protein [Psittacicella gerlachiana]|nr:hypothetical protein [Psittacicella gerlachiana]